MHVWVMRATNFAKEGLGRVEGKYVWMRIVVTQAYVYGALGSSSSNYWRHLSKVPHISMSSHWHVPCDALTRSRPFMSTMTTAEDTLKERKLVSHAKLVAFNPHPTWRVRMQAAALHIVEAVTPDDCTHWLSWVRTQYSVGNVEDGVRWHREKWWQ